MLLQALRSQTAQNWDLTIVDDNDDPSLLRNSHNFNVMLNLLQMEGHRWHVIKGLCKGPHFAHNILLMGSGHELILRMDDDALPSPDFVEKLFHRIGSDGSNIAAVGGVFPDPRQPNLEDCYFTKPEVVAIADQNRLQAVKQRYLHKTPVVENVPVLYSSFMYRRSALLDVGGFPVVYSPIGESEETDTTFRLYHKGYTLVVDQSAVAWHLFAPSGGIRGGTQEERETWFKHDVETWRQRLRLLVEGKFDFEAEKKRNLDPFRTFEKLRLIAHSGFFNYS